MRLSFLIYLFLFVLYIIVEAEESPTVVLDRPDAMAPSQRQPTVSPDPFRDVIKTEPAPDLPSLIEDMIPYLVEHGITTPRPTSMTMVSQTSLQGSTGNQHPSHFEFMEQVPLVQSPFDYEEKTIDSSFMSQIKYGINHEVPSRDTVSLTYDSKDQPSDSKSESPETGIFSYDKISLTNNLNHTNDNSIHDISLNNTAELAKENVSKPDETPDGNFTSKVDNRITKYDNYTESINSPSEDGEAAENAENDDIFSLDSIFELLFPSNTSSNAKSTETTKTPDASSVSGLREDQGALVTSSTTTERLTEETEIVETSSKVLDNEIPMSMGSLLKLAGCNIYGRMYRVGRIITELSSPCQECKCTEIGVQCKQLEC